MLDLGHFELKQLVPLKFVEAVVEVVAVVAVEEHFQLLVAASQQSLPMGLYSVFGPPLPTLVVHERLAPRSFRFRFQIDANNAG